MSISKNALYNLAGSIVPIIIAIVTVPIYLHLIGADRYGITAVASLFLGYFGLFDLGLGRAAAYRIALLDESARQERSDVLWTSIFVNLAMGLLGALLLWIAASIFFSSYFQAPPEIAREIPESLPLLAASLPVATLTGVLTGALSARNRFLEVNLISIVSTALFQVIPIVVAVVAGPRLSYLLAAALISRLGAVLVLLARCHQLFSAGQAVRFNRGEVPLLLRFGGWILADGLLTPILSTVDRFAIGSVLGASSVTIFSIPYQLAQRITILPNALLQALFPRLPSSTDEQRARFGRNALLAIGAVISPLVAGGLYLLPPFMHLWVGQSIGGPAAKVGVLILLGFWYNALGWAPYVWLQGTGRPDLVAKVHMLEVPPYLAALYLGLTHWGLVGAAIVMLVRSALDLGVLAIASRQFHVLRSLVPAATLLSGSAGFCFFVPYDRPLYWIVAVAAISMASLLGWLIMPMEARTKLHTLVKRAAFSS